jgi:hypothetical protein
MAMPALLLKKSKKEGNKKEEALEIYAVKKILNNSQHTESTHSTCYSDTMKTFEDYDTSLSQKVEEKFQLQQEINECQERLSNLHSRVNKLQVDIEEVNSTKKSKTRRQSKPKRKSSFSEEGFQVLYVQATGSQQPPKRGLSHSSRPASRNSICSHGSTLRSDSHHSFKNTGRSRRRHSIRRDSIHSSQSFNKGGKNDGASVVSHKSLQSITPSIKSLPREIELMDEDDNSFYDDSSRKQEKVNISRETKANASTDTLFVDNKQIVDLHGITGVYSGALSKSTGMPNGRGLLEYEETRHWFEGDWIHGRLTGYGRLSNGDGYFYEGGLKNHLLHGTGVSRFGDGRVFEGECIKGELVEGKMTYEDGSQYEGSWLEGARHGRGKCFFADGSEYEGEFWEGHYHGQGKMTWNDGGFYVGEWCDGEIYGKGKEIRPDGTIRHDGEWSQGQPVRRKRATQH